MTSSGDRRSTNPAILSGPVIKRRNWRNIKPGNLTRAERAMAFAERHLIVSEGKLVGKPLKLAGFQEDFFYSVFDNPVPTRRAILSTARKNAKTGTIAILLLVFLVGPEAVVNSRLSSGALSRKQAGEVYNYAAKMAALSPTLRGKVKAIPSSKKLVGLLCNVEYEALAAEGSTAHGGSPLVAILDEAGQVRGPYNAFFEAITTSQGAYENPLEIWISTQAATDGDLFNRLIDDAATADDPATVCHVYRAPQDADLDDEAAWKLANPALGLFKSRSELVDGAAKAKRMPDAENTFRWLHLNQRVTVYNPFIARDTWQANAGEPSDDAFQYGRVFAGLDLSQTTDLTAFVMAALYEGQWHVRCWFWMAEDLVAERSRADRVPYDLWAKQGFLETTPGKSVALDWVAAKIVEVTAGIPLELLAFDRYRMPLLKAELERLGVELPLKEFGQGYASMSPAVQAVEEAALHERLRHGGHPVMNMCANNAVVIKDPAGNRKLDKSKSTGRIDGMVALVMAIGAATMVEAKPVAEAGIVFL
jgi:phage terminase large subunit-like protein